MKKIFTLLLVICNFVFLSVRSQTVSLYAGLPNQPGYSPVHTTKLNFYFNQPYGLAFDSKGNLWISNYGGNTISVICASDGEVYSKGGDNSPGFRNGVASYAVFASPSGIAVGPGDTIYVADMDNCVIRKISPLLSCGSNVNIGVEAGKYSYNIAADHMYKTYIGYADGAANIAQFKFPTDVAVDKQGNIFVADAGNHCIRKITPGGMVSTYAGLCTKSGYKDTIASAALFNYPVALLIGPAPDYNLYVADHDNSAIRMISGGQVSTVNTFDSTWTPSEISINNGGALFIADDQSILMSLTSTIKTLVGPPRSNKNANGYVNGTGFDVRFNDPRHIAIDPADNNTFYVADMSNHVIRKVIGCTSFVPVVIATQTSFCMGDSATLTVQGTYVNYLWSTGEKTQSIVVKNSGSYTCTVTDASACFGTSAPVVITTTSLNPTVTASGPFTFCTGDSVILTVQGTYPGYLWTTAETTQSIVVKTSGTYSCMVTDNNNCTGSSTPINVQVSDLVVTEKNNGPITFCIGYNVILTGNSGLDYYEWYDNGTLIEQGTQAVAQTLNMSTSGLISLKGTKGPCVGYSDTMTITAGNKVVPLIDTIGNTPMCPGDTVYLLTTTPFSSYAWDNGTSYMGNTRQLLITTKGSYIVYVTLPGCTGNSDPVQINLYPVPFKPIMNKVGSDLFSSYAVTYQWYKDGILIPGATSKKLHLTANARYKVETTDNNGCKAMSNEVRIKNLSVDDLEAQNYFEVYPNPANGNININFGNEQPEIVKIIITDVYGRVVLNKIEKADISYIGSYDLSRFARGLYFVTVTIGNETDTVKLMVE